MLWTSNRDEGRVREGGHVHHSLPFMKRTAVEDMRADMKKIGSPTLELAVVGTDIREDCRRYTVFIVEVALDFLRDRVASLCFVTLTLHNQIANALCA